MHWLQPLLAEVIVRIEKRVGIEVGRMRGQCRIVVLLIVLGVELRVVSRVIVRIDQLAVNGHLGSERSLLCWGTGETAATAKAMSESNDVRTVTASSKATLVCCLDYQTFLAFMLAPDDQVFVVMTVSFDDSFRSLVSLLESNDVPMLATATVAGLDEDSTVMSSID